MSGLDTNREKRWTVRIGKSPKGKTKRISLCDYTDSDEKDTSEKKGRKREKGSSKETK